MSTAIIELNDIGVRLSAAENLLGESPGYAVITPTALTLGQAAQQQARLNPQQTNNQFWQQLSLAPLTVGNARARHHADLAFAHLMEIHAPHEAMDEVIFAVPGHYNHDQLSLLLGIAQECPFTAVGMVDAAVAAVAPLAPRGRFVHLDIQLHQSIITLLRVEDQVTREAVDVVPGAGLLGFYDHWTKMISDYFIRQTRFDPEHDAATEQQLFNQMPEWIAQGEASGDTLLQLEGRSIKLPLTTWVAQAQPLYQQLSEHIERCGAIDGIFLGDHGARLPGLGQQWPNVHTLAAQAVAGGCHNHLHLLRGDPQALAFITQLPASASPTVFNRPLSGTHSAPKAVATHLLWRHLAHPLGPHGLYVNGESAPFFSDERSADSLCLVESNLEGPRLRIIDDECAIYLNGQPAAQGARLHPGDKLALGTPRGAAITLISVVENG